MLKLYNSYSLSKQEFKPITSGKVSMYVCGITPYDTTHLGHAFTYVFFDSLKRFLGHQHYLVTYAQNVTDIDDDILKKALEVKKDWRRLGDFWTSQFLRDMRALNVVMPDNYVKATEAIDTIIEMVKKLIDKGVAYQAEGNVYFSVDKFPGYGRLSKLTPRQMLPIQNQRGGNSHDPLKQNPLDFILWQKSLPFEPIWASPWSKGRPGWHIECSAMILKTLGQRIDIHGGGRDLIYPHHESEIAQSESYTNHPPFVKYWMHVGMLSYRGEKMSKSLGNLVMIKDLLEKYSGDAIRWLLLSHHYRSEWEFKMAELDEAETIIKSLSPLDTNPVQRHQIIAKLEDDFDTPKALSILRHKPDREMLGLLGFQSFH